MTAPHAAPAGAPRDAADGTGDDARDPALAVERLAARFGDRPGLADVTLRVAAGERLAILGPSGVGKTTLLRAVAGLAAADAGRILVRGRDVTALPPERRDIVYLHQTPVLFAHLSVAANVAFPLHVRGCRGAACDARVRAALAAVHVAELADRAPAALSGGQRHRVALARAMVARPAALLLDEPLSALDPALRDDVRGAILEAHAVGGEAGRDAAPALVLVTHDLDDAALLADRVAVLVDGAVAQRATPAALFDRPATLAVARFLGTFQELVGRVGADGAVRTALGVVPAAGALPPGARAVVCVRADALRLLADDASGVAGADAVAARVVGVRHRARGASALLRIDDGTADGAAVEAALAPHAPPPPVGRDVAVRLDARRALVFPG